MSKKIIISLSIVGAVAAIIVGGTIAYFSDVETSTDNIFTAGAIDISVNTQNPWTETFTWDDMEPGGSKEIDLVVKNESDNPVKVWKIIKNINTSENGVTEPEQEWYDAYNGGNPKNDLDSAILYEMYVDGNLAVGEKAGITLSQVKDNYVNLVSLDQPFEPNNGDGILYPGHSITVEQTYYFDFVKADNWTQSDQITFDIEILAQQVNAPEPVKQMSFIQNKFTQGDWHAISDERVGLLKYDSYAENFNYDFLGVGLDSNREYNLIYYPDPWENPKEVLVLSDIMTTDNNGKIDNLGNSVDTGDLPNSDDTNYPYGAKIWLVTSDKLPGSKTAGDNSNLNWAGVSDWLFDNWPGSINYKKGGTDTSETKTVYFNQLGGDINNQYGYNHDYSTAVNDNVYLTYETPGEGKLSGTISALGLKPYAAYQVKLSGKSICQYGAGGNDELNEKIGYKGRWTCIDCSCSGTGCNRTDSDYMNYSHYRGDGSQCIVGYLIFDFLTADENGDIVLSDINISSDTSYHVGWCSGSTCGTGSPNDFATYGVTDPAHPSVQFCLANGVNGQPERFGCNGLTLDVGDYDLKIALTEESFHQGNWATVLMGDISFEIK